MKNSGNETGPVGFRDQSTQLNRSQRMASALSAYARALTLENRSRRNLYRLAGLAPRTRDRVFSISLISTVITTLIIPVVCAALYFGFVATPGFTSEVRFVVRSSTPFLSRDRYSGGIADPKEKIVQDTAILLNYLHSPAIIQDMGRHVDLYSIYGRDDIDIISRLRLGQSQDDVLAYWKKHIRADVNPKSGIVELGVTAFSAKEAHEMLRLVLRLAEIQVNSLSSGMWGNLKESTQREVDEATREVAELRGKLRDTQNATGVFDIEMSAQNLTTVLTTVEASIAELRGRQAALGQSVDADSPQMAELSRRLAAQEHEAVNLRAKAAGASTAGSGNLADYSTLFDNLKLNLSLAEKRLKASITELEKVKLISSLQLVYIDNFTEPTLPDKNSHPKVFWSMLLILLASLAACGTLCGVIITLRKKVD